MSLSALLASCLLVPVLCTPAPQVKPTKVMVIVIENRSYAQMQTGAPRIWALARKHAYAKEFYAVTHPSLGNYIAMAFGDTFGIRDSKDPASHPITHPDVFAEAWRHQRRARLYAESMGSVKCRRTNYGRYVVRHAPWAYSYNALSHNWCARYHHVDASFLAADITNGVLPHVGMLIPDNCNNAHDCPLSVADRWVAAKVSALQAGPDYKAGRLAIVITADEDDGSQGNRILTLVIHPSLSGRVVSTKLTTYSLSGALSDFGNSPRLRKAATAPGFRAAFGI